MSTDASRYYEQTNGDDLTTRAASAVSIVSNVPYAILGVAPVAFEGKDNNDKLFDVLVLTLDITGVKKAIEAAKAANGGKFTYDAFVDYIATHTRNGEEVAKRMDSTTLFGRAATFFIGRLSKSIQMNSGQGFSNIDDPGLQRLAGACAQAKAFEGTYKERSCSLLEYLEGVQVVKFKTCSVEELGNKVYPTEVTFVNCLAKEG